MEKRWSYGQGQLLLDLQEVFKQLVSNKLAYPVAASGHYSAQLSIIIIDKYLDINKQVTTTPVAWQMQTHSLTSLALHTDGCLLTNLKSAYICIELPGKGYLLYAASYMHVLTQHGHEQT